jgi:hypothetical protein
MSSINQIRWLMMQEYHCAPDLCNDKTPPVCKMLLMQTPSVELRLISMNDGIP